MATTVVVAAVLLLASVGGLGSFLFSQRKAEAGRRAAADARNHLLVGEYQLGLKKAELYRRLAELGESADGS